MGDQKHFCPWRTLRGIQLLAKSQTLAEPEGQTFFLSLRRFYIWLLKLDWSTTLLADIFWSFQHDDNIIGCFVFVFPYHLQCSLYLDWTQWKPKRTLSDLVSSVFAFDQRPDTPAQAISSNNNTNFDVLLQNRSLFQKRNSKSSFLVSNWKYVHMEHQIPLPGMAWNTSNFKIRLNCFLGQISDIWYISVSYCVCR